MTLVFIVFIWVVTGLLLLMISLFREYISVKMTIIEFEIVKLKHQLSLLNDKLWQITKKRKT